MFNSHLYLSLCMSPHEKHDHGKIRQCVISPHESTFCEKRPSFYPCPLRRTSRCLTSSSPTFRRTSHRCHTEPIRSDRPELVIDFCIASLPGIMRPPRSWCRAICPHHNTWTILVVHFDVHAVRPSIFLSSVPCHSVDCCVGGDRQMLPPPMMPSPRHPPAARSTYRPADESARTTSPLV